MSRISGSGRAAAQAERLARLSEDNAFIDVEAALKRIGVTDAWDSGGVADGTAGGLPSSSAGVAGGGGSAAPSSVSAAAQSASGSGGGGGGGGVRRSGPALKGTRASQEALLSGARVPLTAALVDQHKAYLESVRTAAKTWAERSSSSSSSGSSDNNESEISNSHKNSGDALSSATDRGRGTAVSNPTKGRQGRQKKTEPFSSSAVPAASASEQLVTVTSVQRAPLERSMPPAPPRKRSRTAAAQAEEEATAVVVSNQTRALAEKLTAEVRLLLQWKRTVLEAPPQLINGVLRPEPHATWAASGTPEDAEVLPYPLLQVYSLCPSYEAMAAAPVHRRGVVRQHAPVATAGEEEETPLTITVADTAFHVCGPAPAHAHDAQRRSHRRRRRSSRKDTGRTAARRLDFVEDDGGDGAAQGARQHHLCSVCMLPAAYRCVRCRTALFCSITCHVLHDATRCLKFTV